MMQSRAKDRASAGLPSWKTPQQGAATQCWAATAPELAGRGGLYLEDCQVSGTTPPPGSLGAEAWALDHEAARRLWTVSEEMLGERFAWSYATRASGPSRAPSRSPSRPRPRRASARR